MRGGKCDKEEVMLGKVRAKVSSKKGNRNRDGMKRRNVQKNQ